MAARKARSNSKPPPPAAGDQHADRALKRVFAILCHKTHNDFSSYKLNSNGRREALRMRVHRLKRPPAFLTVPADENERPVKRATFERPLKKPGGLQWPHP